MNKQHTWWKRLPIIALCYTEPMTDQEHQVAELQGQLEHVERQQLENALVGIKLAATRQGIKDQIDYIVGPDNRFNY